MSPRNKKILLGLCTALFVGFAVPHLAHAGFMDSALSDVVTYTVKFIAYIFNFISSLLFGFAGSLVEFMLRLNLSVVAYGPDGQLMNSLVRVGWIITRDIANLGFVLAMIVIGFATIVGSEGYGYKKLLPKLIAAAILVNFSLSIAGVFIDFSHVITNFFMNKVSNTGYFGITEKLANAFGTQNYLLGDANNPLPPNPSDEAGLGTRLSTAVIVSIAEMGFIIAFTLVAAIVLFTLAILLLVRFVYLSFLLILAPMSWLFWVIPGQGKQFSNWWSKFIEQVFFAPAITFFIYLALASVEALGAQPETSEFFKAGTIQAVLTAGSQMVVLVGILIGGLMAAQKMGVSGAAMGIDRASAFGTIAKNYASNTAKGWGRSIAKSNTGQAISRQALRFGGGVKQLGEYKPTTKAGKVASVLSAPWRAPAQAALSLAGRVTQTTIGGAPSKPDSLGSLAWASITGGSKGVGGQYDKAKKEKEDKDLPKLQEEHEKKLAKKKLLEETGADIGPINKEIAALESDIKKKTEPKDTEGALVKQVEDLRKKREEFVQQGLDPKMYNTQIEKVERALERMKKEDFEKSPARNAWESEITRLNTTRDEMIMGGKIKPGEKNDALDEQIKRAKEQARAWQRFDTQKPKGEKQWLDRKTELQGALEEARNAKLSAETIEEIVGLQNDADGEIEEIRKKQNKGNKGGGTPQEAPKQSPIITSGFNEYTPVDKIKTDSGENPKIIT